MREMDRRLAPLLLLVLTVCAGCASSLSRSRTTRPPAAPGRPPASTGVAVSPASGSPGTTFTVSFTVPPTVAAGRVRGLWVSANGPAGGGCASTALATPASAPPGARTSAALAPRGGMGWCPGEYSGRVVATLAPDCKPGAVCPMVLVALPVGRFSFRVAH